MPEENDEVKEPWISITKSILTKMEEKGYTIIEKSKVNRHWYRILASILTAIMIGITTISGIYYKRAENRANRLGKVESKIEMLLKHKEKLSKIPKIKISLLTLEDSGLPSSAFRSLTEIPAVIRISHVGGETAKGITVQVTSSANILSFIPEFSVEKFDYKIDPNRQILSLDIKQMRRNSIIEGTIKCPKIAPMSFETSIDYGRLIDNSNHLKEKEIEKSISFEDIDTIDVSNIKDEKSVDILVSDLKILLKQEEEPSKNDWKSITSKIFSSAMFPLIFGIVVGIIIFLSSKRSEFKKGYKAQELGNKIGKCKQDNLIRQGMTEAEIEDLLGPPHEISISNTEGNVFASWKYEPPETSSFGWQPNVYIDFIGGKVIRFVYREYGKKSYS